MNKKLVKQDINFLEYPFWLQDQESLVGSDDDFLWEDLEGFSYQTSHKPPAKIDTIFLYGLLLETQHREWEENIELSRYQLLKNCGLGEQRNAYWYKRLEESLERWMHVVITFEGTFYDGGNHIKMQFHILEDWELDKKTKKLRVRLSPKWLERIKKSKFFKLLDFDQMKALRSPLRALY